MSEMLNWDEAQKPRPEAQEEDPKEAQFQARMYGALDHGSLEMMLVGYLVEDETCRRESPTLSNPRNADLMIEAGIKGDWFENKFVGKLFDMSLAYYTNCHRLLSLNDTAQFPVIMGGNLDAGQNYKEVFEDCLATVLSWKIKVDLLVKRFKNHYYEKKADEIYQEFIQARANPSIGPEKALDKFRRACTLELSDPSGAPLKSSDLSTGLARMQNWVLDMKHHPEKYRGFVCGIKAIDKRTVGFQKGQLTVFVGRPGGYKSTIMLCIAYGLAKRGVKVLYVSLEMMEDLLCLKLACIHKLVGWTKLYSGQISEPEDWIRQEAALKRSLDESLSQKERDEARAEAHRLTILLSGIVRGQEERVLVEQTRKDMEKFPLKILTAGTSNRVKVSQIEKWLEEQRETFQPDVIIVDYLALVASDQSYPDRRDLEVGDICKRFRSIGARLGLHVITAAQIKRSAIERIRKFGFNTPEKANLGTDDIAESNQIGADSDTTFILWPKEGGNQIVVFTPKSRHAASNADEGETIQVDPEHCQVGDFIDSTTEISSKISQKDAYMVFGEINKGQSTISSAGGDFRPEDAGTSKMSRGEVDDGSSRMMDEDIFK